MKPRMPLMDDDTRSALPEIDWDHDRECDFRDSAVVKFFTSDGSRIWYAAEWDGFDVFRGLVINNDSAKISDFDLDELEDYRDSLGNPVERDPDFDGANMGDLKEQFEFRKMAMACATNNGTADQRRSVSLAPRLPTRAEKNDLFRHLVNRCQKLFHGSMDGLDSSNDVSLIQHVIDAANIAVLIITWPDKWAILKE